MFSYIFSGDFPRSKMLTLLLVVIVAGLVLTPWLFPGSRSMETAMRIAIFIVLVASYDLLLGYTGIVSFAHTMFFGIGAYGVAITLNEMGRSYEGIVIGTLLGFVCSVFLAFLIGLFSLRVKAIFFAMVTLAVASAFTLLVSQLYQFTGGEDGLTYSIPRELSPAFKLVQDKIFGVQINGKLLLYYSILFISFGLFLFMLRVVNSPFGRVLQAIRENEFRAEAIGYRTVIYRTATNCLAAGVAALAGSLMAIWLKYTGPDTTLSLNIMVDILLMVVIGGMGTLYGAVIGSTLFIMAQNYLQELMKVASDQFSAMGLPLLPELIHPDRWLLWFGILFILSVYFFPTGIVGRLRKAKT
ncbi:MAG: branched-chain amino acid ABC transporter permease [Terasakiella sp.]|uniref:branched-chain amino acid ABC transporter permease n=1 Tax=unclassified Terasakiella TaxID=2614952 RepID=UPI003AFFEC87